MKSFCNFITNKNNTILQLFFHNGSVVVPFKYNTEDFLTFRRTNENKHILLSEKEKQLKYKKGEKTAASTLFLLNSTSFEKFKS